ncbi:MAG: tetratricopeptide repeat protein [Sandaracinaceae bacterium]
MRLGIWLALSLALAALCTGLGAAHAQEEEAEQAADAAELSEEERTERARTLFGEGLELADAGDWDRAVHRFRRALELRAAAPIRYNLATSLARMGRLVEALEECAAIIEDPEADDAVKEAARALQVELDPRLGRLTISVRGDATGTHVTLDGRPWETLGAPAAADPGIRVARLMREMEELDIEEVDVPEGGTAQVQLEVPVPLAVVAETTPDPDPIEEPIVEPGSDDGLIIGLIVGAGVLAVGAAILIAVLVSDQSGPQPSMGDFMPGVLEFD